MNTELISKRELLKLYGISYGALYRWKRKGLIPEEWFIKKATVTGQETFFPKELICERIALIIDCKEDLSLSEISKNFSFEARNEPTLVIDTVFGKKTFYLKDINSAVIDGADGGKRDITDYIKGGNS